MNGSTNATATIYAVCEGQDRVVVRCSIVPGLNTTVSLSAAEARTLSNQLAIAADRASGQTVVRDTVRPGAKI